MYIRREDDDHLLIRTVQGPDGNPEEEIIGRLGFDPELNLFAVAETGRRGNPEKWRDIDDFHLLQALENFKRRPAGMKPALVAYDGRKAPHSDDISE